VALFPQGGCRSHKAFSAFVIHEDNRDSVFFGTVGGAMLFERRIANEMIGCCIELVLPKIFSGMRYQEKVTWTKGFYPAQWRTPVVRVNKPD